MNPEVGVIWEWKRDDVLTDEEEGPVLIVEYKGESRRDGRTYYGLDMLTGEHDTFIFNDRNMQYWRKVA